MRKNVIGLCVLLVSCYNLCFANGKRDVYSDSAAENVEEAMTGEEIPEVLLPKYKLKEYDGEKLKFTESWGYVMQNRENEYNNEMPVSDVCYFSAEVNCYGELVGIPNRSRLNVGKARCHLVITCDSKSLSHFVINPDYGIRKTLIKDIVKAAEKYDGVQIDFEQVPARDRKHFITFIADLRYSLKGKMLSVCVPARFKLLSEDIYPYSEIATYCDRVFVMAYDEHWSSSVPGPIASVEWCKKITDYAVKSIPEKKLIMGVPFYGRTWTDKTVAGAWYFSGIDRILTENQVETITYENDIPTFTYKGPVEIKGYFNDSYSALKLCEMYKSNGIQKIGFWRIGMEQPEFWNWIETSK